MKYAKRLAQRVIEGEAFVVDPRAKAMHSFNPVGSRIWELIGKGSDKKGMARTLSEEFEVSEAQALKDVEDFLAKLRKLELIEG